MPRFGSGFLGILLAAQFVVGVHAQDFSEVLIERIATNLAYANGAAWSPGGFFVWSDVPNSKMWQFTPGKPPVILREGTKKAAGAAYDGKGDLYLCESEPGRLVRVPAKGGILEELASGWQGKPFNSPNAVAVRKDGQVYFTDPAFGSANAKKQLDFYGIYRFNTEAKRDQLSLVSKSTARPNGIAISPDGRRLYVALADDRSIAAYDLDKDGAAGNERVFVKGIKGIPGGLTVDEKGNLYVAARGVAIYSPEGKLLHTIEVGEGAASDVTFGGAAGDVLLITGGPNVYLAKMPVKGAFPWEVK